MKMGRDFFGPGFVTELCQHCGHEITLLWDTTILGFEAVCPVCGSRLMLCDECRHAAESGPCDYNRGNEFLLPKGEASAVDAAGGLPRRVQI